MSTIVKSVEESPHLLDILIEIEDVLDSVDLYVFKNWIDGEIVIGPVIRRYFVDLSLRYEYDKMPDPVGARRLDRIGIKVSYERKKEEVPMPTYLMNRPETRDQFKNNSDVELKDIWVVHLEFPRKLLRIMNNATSADFYSDEVDVDDVYDAIEMGIDTETGVSNV